MDLILMRSYGENCLSYLTWPEACCGALSFSTVQTEMADNFLANKKILFFLFFFSVLREPTIETVQYFTRDSLTKDLSVTSLITSTNQ